MIKQFVLQSLDYSIRLSQYLYNSMKQSYQDDSQIEQALRKANSNRLFKAKKEVRVIRYDQNSNNLNEFEEKMDMKKSKNKKEPKSPEKRTVSKKAKTQSKQPKKMIQHLSKDGKKEDKNSNRKMVQNLLQNTENLNEYHFKNKQSKETARSFNTKGILGYKKSEILSTDRFKKINTALSPTRNIKNKASSTHSKKFLKSTQQTFKESSTNGCRKWQVSRMRRQQESEWKEPKEYVLIDDSFLSINNDEANILDKKISSYKHNPKSNLKKHSHENQSSLVYDVYMLEDVFQKSRPSFEQIDKIITIQRWWRNVLKKRHRNLNPIIFDQLEANDFRPQNKKEQSYKQLQAPQIEDSISPLQFMEINNSNISINNNSRQIERKLNPLELRQQLAREEYNVHKQLLEKLLKMGKITDDTYLQKVVLTQAKLYNEMQKINDIKRILNENSKLVHEMTQKLKEDCVKIDQLEGQVTPTMLDQIFGKENSSSKNEKNNQNYQNTAIDYEKPIIVNRQKSNGCHYDTKSSQLISRYSKSNQAEDNYVQDFSSCEIEAGQSDQSIDHNYNTNFTEMLQLYKKQQQAAMEIDHRATVQMGMTSADFPLSAEGQVMGFDTSLNAIHHFLLSFFKFYICYYRDQFLRLVNMPYGYDVNRRIKFLQGYEVDDFYPEQDEEGIIYGLQDVIHEDILDEFHERTCNRSEDSSSTTRRVNHQFEKIHNRALFDCFNMALNQFRPYYELNGTPYPWNYSEKALTFYCIAEQNIQQVFQKTQFKVLKWASTLCGIIVEKFYSPCVLVNPSTPMEDALDLYRNSSNPSLFKARQERFNRDWKQQICENNNSNWGIYEDQFALLQIENSEYVFNKMIEELVLEFYQSGLYGEPLAINQEIQWSYYQQDDFHTEQSIEEA